MAFACLVLIGMATASPQLEARYDHAALPGGEGGEAGTAAAGRTTKGYAVLIALHGVLGFLALQVIAPLAVVIAAVGRSWPNNLWFRLHWKMQAYGSWPVLLLAVTFAVFAATVGREEGGVAPERLDLHQITWGFDEYERRLGREVPMWIQILHFAVAGVAPLIITPFILVRGFLRMRRGQTFAQAFFGRDQPEPYQPPRKMFLNTSTYLEQSRHLYPTVHDADLEKDEIGTSYEKGRGAEGRLRVDSHASSWPGAATREEYEHEVASTIGHGSVVSGGYDDSLYDYPGANSAPVFGSAKRVILKEEKSSLLSSAAPMGTSSTIASENVPSTSEAEPSQIPYRLPTPAPMYPPSASQVFVPPPMLPPIDPVSPPPVPAPARSASIASTFAGFSSFSPRLAFMPFSGSTPAAMPAPTDVTSLSLSSASVSSADTAATPLFVYEEPASNVPTVVPSPPLVPPRPMASTPATSIATDLAVENDSMVGGEMDPAPALTRQVSSAARIEEVAAFGDVPSPSSDTELAQRGQLHLEVANPDPPSDEEDSAGKVTSPLADDSESSRLMDELERQLTISTTASGRRPRAESSSGDFSPPAEQTAPEREQEQVAEATLPAEQATLLAREQSGKWLGGDK
ncbi:hypothetical protein JCM10908_006469 [Rhodotorula pacifica]|uniref:uncharacterized protein n=1 Tax=Rhodotorula pacifica TaxID=1495444 RepID=UPI003173D557